MLKPQNKMYGDTFHNQDRIYDGNAIAACVVTNNQPYYTVGEKYGQKTTKDTNCKQGKNSK